MTLKPYFALFFALVMAFTSLVSCKDKDEETPQPQQTEEDKVKDALRVWAGETVSLDLKTAPVSIVYKEFDTKKEGPAKVLKGKEELTVARIEEAKKVAPRVLKTGQTTPLVTRELIYPIKQYDAGLSADAIYFISTPTGGSKKGTIVIRQVFGSASTFTEETIWEATIDVL